MSFDFRNRHTLQPIRPLRAQNLGIMTKEPLPPVLIPPKDGILRGVKLHVPIPRPLLVAVANVQDVLVLPRLALDQAGAGHAHRLVRAQRRGQVVVPGQALPERGGVLEGLGGALGEVGEHGVAGVAEEAGLAGRVHPFREDGQVAETPLHEVPRESTQLPYTRLPPTEPLAQLPIIPLDDPDIVRRLVAGGGADDNVVQLAIADGVADEVRLRPAPGRRARVREEGGEVGIGEELLAWDEDAVGHVTRVTGGVGLAGQEGAGDGLDAVGGDDEIGREDLAVLGGGAGHVKVVGDDALLGLYDNARLVSSVKEPGVKIGAVDEVVRSSVSLDNVVKRNLDDGRAVLPPDKVVLVGCRLLHLVHVHPPAQ